jgi:two-component system cell cycle response regulator DivK
MSSGRILYIEDNFDNRILIKRILEAEGYTVIEAENGIKGLEMAKNDPTIGLVLMDINLPDLDGYECTARLRKTEQGRKLPIVALTANVMEGDGQKALDAGCDGYIPKPIDVDNLPIQVQKYMNHRPSESVSVPEKPTSSGTAPEKVGLGPVQDKPAVSSPVPEQSSKPEPVPDKPVISGPAPEQRSSPEPALEKPSSLSTAPEKPTGLSTVPEKPGGLGQTPEKPSGTSHDAG